MKQELFKNQISFYIKKYKEELNNLEINYKKGDVPDSNFIYNNLRLSGILSTLCTFDFDSNLEEQIHKKFNFAKNIQKNNIDFSDRYNGELLKMHYFNGVEIISLLLLTITENSLSACPINKDILLEITINKLIEEIKITTVKKTLDDLKKDLKITKTEYEKNKKYLI